MSGVRVVSDKQLSDVLCEFARTMATEFPIQGILDQLVQRIVELLPIEAAGVALISGTAKPRFVAGSDESAVRYENLQVELGEGPCLAAYETDRPIAIPDLAVDADERFPDFRRRAQEEGLVAVFTFPLRNDDRCLGALDLYRTSPGALSDRHMSVAQSLADVTTAYLLNAEARQAKTEFVATLSHELRTPMTTITGFSEMLADGAGGGLTVAQNEFVDAIRRSSDRLTALADRLLTLSRLEAGAFDPARVNVNLGKVVRGVQSELAAAVAARGLEVTFSVPADPVMVIGDVQGLESMVSNLVGNALKYTQDGGRVRCGLQVVGDQARLRVSDSGIGIPEAEQPDLFTRFFRSSTSVQRSIPGTGLGLNIVDSIVRSHGGTISVVSEHLVGSTFTVDLPLLGAAPVTRPAVAVG